MKVPKHLVLKMEAWRNSLLPKLINKVSARLSKRRSHYRIPLLPNWFLTKEWTFRGKKFKLSNYPWHIFITKHEDRGLWQDMDIHFGRLLDIAVRWDGGKRRYVGVRFWLTPYKPHLSNCSSLRGTWEFYHEIWKIENKFPVSRWWWGHGWFRATSRGGLSGIYRHFGHLFRWTWNGHRHGFLGKELTAEEKEKVLEEYELSLKKWGHKDVRIYFDAITGYSRNLEKEYYWACCVDCRILMHPYELWGEKEYLRCDECRERHEKKLDGRFVA